jgi:peptidoglycan/LPS O-acetylase OafA/YrhL
MTARRLTPGFSLSLDLIRFWAALVVLFSHFTIQRISGGLFWQFNIIPFGHHAVIFFFVLSGLLMAYIVQGRENTALKFYSARIVRLSTVVVPMLFLVPLIDLIGSNFSEDNYQGISYSLFESGKQMLLGATFLHESWWQSTRYFSNTPYWRIAYEFWYYIAFGTLVFLKGIRRWFAFFMTVLVAGPKLFLLFPVWMMGVAVWHITRVQIPKWLAMPMFVVSLTT